MGASRAGKAHTVERLLAAGASVNLASAAGGTALIAACLTGSTECVRRLMAARADATVKSAQGKTALECPNPH